MTNDPTIETLQFKIKKLDLMIKDAESNIKEMKSERIDIKKRISNIINSQNVSSAHNLSPINPIQDRKNSF